MEKRTSEQKQAKKEQATSKRANKLTKHCLILYIGLFIIYEYPVIFYTRERTVKLVKMGIMCTNVPLTDELNKVKNELQEKYKSVKRG